jgi:hypothetical protein
MKTDSPTIPLHNQINGFLFCRLVNDVHDFASYTFIADSIHGVDSRIFFLRVIPDARVRKLLRGALQRLNLLCVRVFPTMFVEQMRDGIVDETAATAVLDDLHQAHHVLVADTNGLAIRGFIA